MFQDSDIFIPILREEQVETDPAVKMRGNGQEKSTPILKRVLNSFEIANVALNKHFYRTEECPALAELTSLPRKFSDP